MFINECFSFRTDSPQSRLVKGILHQSGHTLAGILLQQGKERFMYPIRYASRQMLDTEHRYSESEKHALSLIFCVEKFKHYLIGRHFVIISNNGLAKQVLQSTHPLGRLAKWLAILQ